MTAPFLADALENSFADEDVQVASRRFAGGHADLLVVSIGNATGRLDMRQRLQLALVQVQPVYYRRR